MSKTLEIIPESFVNKEDMLTWGTATGIESLEEEHPSTDYSKNLYRESIRFTSSSYLQQNWLRIVRSQIDDIEKHLVITKILANRAAHPQPPQAQVDPDLIATFVTAGGRDSVIKLWAKVSDKFSVEAMQKISDAIRETIATEFANTSPVTIDESDPSEFVVRANRLDTSGYRNAAMDLLYERIDQVMRDGDFDVLDSVLKTLDAEHLSLDVILGVLTATLPARRRLPTRKTFFQEAERTLRARGEYDDGILTGLE